MTKSSQCTYSGMDKQCCARCKAQPPSVHVLTGTIQHGDESITVPYILCIPCFDDQALQYLVPKQFRERLATLAQNQQAPKVRQGIILCLSALLRR